MKFRVRNKLREERNLPFSRNNHIQLILRGKKKIIKFHVQNFLTRNFCDRLYTLSTTYGVSFDREQTYRSAKEAVSRSLPLEARRQRRIREKFLQRGS